MKKLIIAYLAALSLAPAEISVNWSNTNPVLNSLGAPIAVNSIFQLIWSPDAAISPFDPTNALIPNSSEILLDQQRNSAPNPAFPGQLLKSVTNYSSATYGKTANYLVGGYTYVRIFDYQGVGIIPDGTYYIQGAISNQLGNVDLVPPGAIGVSNIGASGSVQMSQQFFAVPEPGTLATIAGGLAVVVFGLRRRRYRI